MQKSSLDNGNNNRKTTWLLSTYIFAVNHDRWRKEKGNDKHSHIIHGCDIMAGERRILRSWFTIIYEDIVNWKEEGHLFWTKHVYLSSHSRNLWLWPLGWQSIYIYKLFKYLLYVGNWHGPVMSAVSLAKYILVRLGSCTSTVTDFSNQNKKTKNANLNISAWSLVEQVNVHLPTKGFSEVQSELRYDITNVPIFSFHDIKANFCHFCKILRNFHRFFWLLARRKNSKFSARVYVIPILPAIGQKLLKGIKRPPYKGRDNKSEHNIEIIP